MLNTAVTGPARISDDALAAVEREAVEHGVSRTQGPLFASRNAQLAGTRAASGPPAHFRVRVDAESSVAALTRQQRSHQGTFEDLVGVDDVVAEQIPSGKQTHTGSAEESNRLMASLVLSAIGLRH